MIVFVVMQDKRKEQYGNSNSSHGELEKDGVCDAVDDFCVFVEALRQMTVFYLYLRQNLLVYISFP